MPQDRQSLAADLYLFNFVLHGLKLHFTKIAVLRYLLFILIFLKVDDEKYQVGNAECKSHELNNCFISGISKVETWWKHNQKRNIQMAGNR